MSLSNLFPLQFLFLLTNNDIYPFDAVRLTVKLSQSWHRFFPFEWPGFFLVVELDWSKLFTNRLLDQCKSREWVQHCIEYALGNSMPRDELDGRLNFVHFLKWNSVSHEIMLIILLASFENCYKSERIRGKSFYWTRYIDLQWNFLLF